MDYVKEYYKLKNERTVIQNKINSLLSEWAENTCPFKIDQIIKNDYSYTHNGKRIKIFDIIGYEDHGFNKLQWQVKAIVLKKVGSESRNVVEFSQWQYESK